MHVFVKEYTDCLRQVFANFAAGEIDKEYETALGLLQKKVSFPGYRQGKVPFDIIEKNNSDELMRTIVNSCVLKAAEKLRSDGVRIYSEPRFKPLTNLTRGSAFSFSMVFDSVPTVVRNIDLDNAVVEYDEYYYDDKMMEQSIRRDFKNLEEVSGKIEDGDTVTVKVKNPGFDGDDEKTLDSHVVTKLVGRKKGDSLKLDFSELDTYVVDYLGRAEGSVDLEIVKVERASEQEVTDELIQQVSVFKSVEDYKKSMKTRFEGMLNDFNNTSKKNALLDYFSKNAQVDYPKSEFIRESRRELADFVEGNFAVSEISLSSLISDKKVREDLSDLPSKINKNIIFFIAVMDIAEKFKVQPEKESIDRVARSQAREHGLSLEEYKEKASQEEWSTVLERAKFDSALGFLTSKVKFQAKGKLPLVK